MTTTQERSYKPKDFASSQDVRWCPGCGDHSILAVMKKMIAGKGQPPEKYAFVSGIGCSSRFPYYMNTYGIHGIHGRAMAIATGVKLSNPDLITFVITGDGDGLAIGGNHLIHTIRRNLDLKILLFNNRIYSLTKGQYSPTTPMGMRTKTSPQGTLENPFVALSMALSSGAPFVARAVDSNPRVMEQVLSRAHDYKGLAFVEIYQNCCIFNDGTFEYARDREIRDENLLELEHGKPMLYGKGKRKGIVFRDHTLHPVDLDTDRVSDNEILIHDEQGHPSVHMALANMTYPQFPEPIGVLRCVHRPTYSDLFARQMEEEPGDRSDDGLQKVLLGPTTWRVNGSGGNGT